LKEFFFYNITERDFFKDSAILIEQLFKQGIKALILCPDDEVSSFFDDYLWSFKEESFIPHTVLDSDTSHLEAIIISKEKLSMAAFKTLVILKGSIVDTDYCNRFEKIYYFFDDNNDDEKKLARTLWRESVKQGTNCKYWKVEKNKWNLMRTG